MRRPYNLSPIGWADATLPARLNYQRFAAVVERARREVLRAMPDKASIHVIAMSAEADHHGAWGEFYPPTGPVVINQFAYETMPDQENYYRQIKAVLVHEFEHATGEMHGEPIRAYVASGRLPYVEGSLQVTVG